MNKEKFRDRLYQRVPLRWHMSLICMATVASGGGSSSSKSSFDGLDVDEGIIFVLVIALVVAIVGSAGYLVYQAPEILFEAVFETALAAGMIKQARNMKSEGWHYVIFKRTWWLCAIVLVLAMTFGYMIKKACPEASSYSQYRHMCRR